MTSWSRSESSGIGDISPESNEYGPACTGEWQLPHLPTGSIGALFGPQGQSLKSHSLYFDAGHGVTFEVNGKSYVGSAEKKLQVPGGMPVKKLKALFPDHFGLSSWRAPGSLIDGSREEEIDSVSLFSETTAFPLVLTGWLTVPKSSEACSVTVIPSAGSKTGTSEKNSLHQYVMTRPDELVMLRAVSKLKDYVVFAWTSPGDLWHTQSPMALVPPWGEYYPRLCTREQFEKLALVDVLLEQTQGGQALASNSYSYGGHFVHSLRLGTGAPISFTASVSPESEFVCWQFYRGDESQPFLTADKTRVDLHWTQAANAVARVVTRPKDEYKLHLETKVADPGTPGDDCPGYVVVEDARTIGTISYHGPKRYYPKDGWVRIRAVANPGYRFVKWDAGEEVEGAVLTFWGPIHWPVKDLEVEEIAVRLDKDTTIRAVFEPHITLQFGLSEGGPYKDVDPPDMRPIEHMLVSDNPDVYIAAIEADTIWFQVPELKDCGDLVTWGGAASGSGWRTSVQFTTEGDYEVTATANGKTRRAKLKVIDEINGDLQKIAQPFGPYHPYGLAACATAKDYMPYVISFSQQWPMGGGWEQGRTNACTHSFWNAIIGYFYGEETAIAVTEAYENEEEHDHNNTVMDMLNNAVGASVGASFSHEENVDSYRLRNAIIHKLNEGELWMLSEHETYTPLGLLLRTNEITGDDIPSPDEPPYWANDIYPNLDQPWPISNPGMKWEDYFPGD